MTLIATEVLLTMIGGTPNQAMPRPPRGPGDDEDNELPMGDPPDDDETDDPSDEDEGVEDDEPLHGAPTVRAGPV
jgi:hypothetical protein